MYIYIKELENEEEIQQLKKAPKWIRKWIGKIIYKMNWIMENRIEENRKVYLIPNLGNKNREKRIRKKLEREPIQKLQIILSHKMKPYKAEDFEDRVFEFKDKPNIRIYHRPPVRNFLVENIDGKWLYWGLIHIIEIHHDYIKNTTSGKYKIIYINTPEEMKHAHNIIDRNESTKYIN